MAGIIRVMSPKSSVKALTEVLEERRWYQGFGNLGLNSASRFQQFWDLMDAVKLHGYLRAAMSVVGRSVVGTWWRLVLHPEYKDEATERQRKSLMRFYLSLERPWSNIRDFQGMAYKLMIGAMYLRYFGQCAYQIVRDERGRPIGLDFLHGYVVPNVDANGNFLDPAFWQYPSRNSAQRVGYPVRDVVYITNPDWEGYPTGGTDIEALSEFALPLDLYLLTAARQYLRNRDRPEAYYILPADISEEAFRNFVEALQARYSGVQNVGRSPIVVAGDLEIKELSKLPSDLPYQEARLDTRREVLAVTGVSEAKLGLTEGMTQSNLRELRREFHETTMLPLFRLIEEGFYEQIHVREFNVRGWMFKFNNPDFLTAVERATVHLRYRNMGVLSANEIRADLGREPRQDPGGDTYLTPLNMVEEPGSPPEGRPVEPDAPSQVGEPSDSAGDPVRGDRSLSELRQWRRFAIRRMKEGKPIRPFKTEHIPEFLAEAIQHELEQCQSVEDVRSLFDSILQIVEVSDE